MADAPTDQNIIDPIEAEAAPEPSKLTPEERMQTFKQWFKADQGHSQKWRAQARSTSLNSIPPHPDGRLGRNPWATANRVAA